MKNWLKSFYLRITGKGIPVYIIPIPPIDLGFAYLIKISKNGEWNYVYFTLPLYYIDRTNFLTTIKLTICNNMYVENKKEEAKLIDSYDSNKFYFIYMKNIKKVKEITSLFLVKKRLGI